MDQLIIGGRCAVMGKSNHESSKWSHKQQSYVIDCFDRHWYSSIANRWGVLIVREWRVFRKSKGSLNKWRGRGEFEKRYPNTRYKMCYLCLHLNLLIDFLWDNTFDTQNLVEILLIGKMYLNNFRLQKLKYWVFTTKIWNCWSLKMSTFV